MDIIKVYRDEQLRAFQWLGDFPLPLDPDSIIFLDDVRKVANGSTRSEKPVVEQGDWIVCRITDDMKVQAVYAMDEPTFQQTYVRRSS